MATSSTEADRKLRAAKRSCGKLRETILLLVKKPVTLEVCNEIESALDEFDIARADHKLLAEAALSVLITETMSAEDVDKLEANTYRDVDDLTAAAIRFKAHLKTCRQTLSVAKSRESLHETSFRQSADGSGNVISDIQFPKIEVPKFNGDMRNYLEWKGLFSNLIHDVPIEKMANIKKMYYLKLAMVDKAKDILAGYKNEEACYPEAWAYLNSRFDNRRSIIRAHFIDLMNIQPIKSEAGLRKMLDDIHQIVRSLKICGEDVDAGCMSSFLCYYLCTKLDNRTRREFETSITTDNEYPKYRVLLKFLQNRSFIYEDSVMDSEKSKSSNTESKSKSTEPTKKSFTITKKSSSAPALSCSNCKKAHRIWDCEQYKSKTPKERHELIRKLQLCQNCLRPNHTVANCKSRYTCSTCNRRHHSTLHFEPKAESTKQNETEQAVSLLTSLNIAASNRLVILPSAVVRFQINTLSGKLRLLMDCCSQSTLITDAAVRRHRLPHKPLPVASKLDGVGQGSVRISRFVSMKLFSRVKPFSLDVEANVVPASSLRYSINHQLDAAQAEALRIPNLADPAFYQKTLQIEDVGIILGAQYYESCIRNCSRNIENLTLRDTYFGWTVSGTVDCKSNTKFSYFSSGSPANLTELEINDSLKKYWSIHDFDSDAPSNESNSCVEHFNKSVSRAEDGKFVVRLPFKNPRSSISHNRNLAIGQLLRLEKSLSDEMKKHYVDFMKEYQELGHMEKVDVETQPRYYIPHQFVLRPDSTTTSFHVVFNASSHARGSISLNDALMAGQPTKRHLFDILVTMRSYLIVFCADIAKMYRMVWVHPDDQPMQSIVWRESPQESILDYQLRTVTYGTVPASFLATKCLLVLADFIQEDHPVAAHHIRENFYMDDLISGANSVEEAISLQNSIHDTLKSAGFVLRKYSSNSEKLLAQLDEQLRAASLVRGIENSSLTSVLGIIWNSNSDLFQIKLNLNFQPSPSTLTKRSILSLASRVIDPLGFVEPVTVAGKLIFQRLWLEEKKWDELVSQSLAANFIDYYTDLANLRTFEIPRCLTDSRNPRTRQLIGFADASDRAYCAVVYQRAILDNNIIICSFMAARSRIAPLKKPSVQRLELQAALLLAEFIIRIADNLNIKPQNIFCFTDSADVLCWLSKSADTWKPFVAHRVSKIETLIPFSKWNYVNTKNNPADFATRGITVSTFLQRPSWIKGPEFLYLDNPFAANVIPNLDVREALEKRKKKSSSFFVEQNVLIFEKYSNYLRLIRVVAYILRWTKIVNKKESFKSPVLSTVETRQSHNVVIRCVQRVHFSREIKLLSTQRTLKPKFALAKLNPWVDQTGILRVGGRLENSSFSSDRQHPIILPAKSQFCLLLVRHLHKKFFHAGRKFLESYLIAQYWIIGGRTNLIKRVCHSCIRCCRGRAQTQQQLMGQLPAARTSVARPFTNTGVDLAGPFTCKCVGHRNNRFFKSYMALFICLGTRAVHLEALSDLSTAGFLACLQRFIARRGIPRCIFSDNATNFTGASNFFRDNQEQLASTAVAENFKWYFIPPRAPHQGGIWEAGIKSAKKLLQNVTNGVTLSFEEYTTLFARIEAILNSRPLCYVRHLDQESTPITPAHFLAGEPLVQIPVLDEDNKLSFSKGLKLLRNTSKSFWNAWSKDYINQLQYRQKWNVAAPNVKVGDIVMVKNVDTPSYAWPLAIVEEIHVGVDGLVRVVNVRMSNRTIKKRAVQSLVLLPVESTPSFSGKEC